MKATRLNLLAALLGVGSLVIFVPCVRADDATDHANQLAQAQKEREEWQAQREQAQRDRDEWHRQQDQAQRDRDQAERDRQALQDWHNQLAQAQKERDDWYKQQEQAQRDREQAERDRQALQDSYNQFWQAQKERDDSYKQREQAQKEWDDWYKQREQAQNDWDQRQQNLDDYLKSIQDANYRALDAYPGYPYSGASAAEIASIPRPMPRTQARFPVPATLQRRPAPLNAIALKQMALQHQAQVHRQLLQTRQEMRQTPPQFIQNPFVGSPQNIEGRQELDQRIIQNPFVDSSPAAKTSVINER